MRIAWRKTTFVVMHTFGTRFHVPGNSWPFRTGSEARAGDHAYDARYLTKVGRVALPHRRAHAFPSCVFDFFVHFRRVTAHSVGFRYSVASVRFREQGIALWDSSEKRRLLGGEFRTRRKHAFYGRRKRTASWYERLPLNYHPTLIKSESIFLHLGFIYAFTAVV